jgi:hypothetical protein
MAHVENPLRDHPHIHTREGANFSFMRSITVSYMATKIVVLKLREHSAVVADWRSVARPGRRSTALTVLGSTGPNRVNYSWS